MEWSRWHVRLRRAYPRDCSQIEYLETKNRLSLFHSAHTCPGAAAVDRVTEGIAPIQWPGPTLRTVRFPTLNRRSIPAALRVPAQSSGRPGPAPKAEAVHQLFHVARLQKQLIATPLPARLRRQLIL